VERPDVVDQMDKILSRVQGVDTFKGAVLMHASQLPKRRDQKERFFSAPHCGQEERPDGKS